MRDGGREVTGGTQEILDVPVAEEVSLTQRLRASFGGRAHDVDELLREILPKLREIATRETRRERHRSPLSPTELIHEVWLRNLSRANWTVRDRGHFFAIASLAMRRVLTDLARKRLADRRNSDNAVKTNGSEKDAGQIVEIGILMERLEMELPDAARVVDMHYFAGFTFVEIAESNGLTVRQVLLRWKKGMKWLRSNHNASYLS